jgi:hypothetical protein
MKRQFLFLFLLGFLATLPLGAQQLQAVVKEATGKVEVQPAGGDWQAVTVNMVIAKGSTVSTGFSSRLVLQMGLTQVIVKPLTRLLLEDLVKRDSTNVTSVALKVGKVNASVKAAAGERNEFTLKGPASTAAVRGTEFEYDGYTLQVTEGVVEFFNLLSQRQLVGGGDSSETDGYTYPTGGEDDKSNQSKVGGPGGGPGNGGGGGGGNTPPVLTGGVMVTIQ